MKHTQTEIEESLLPEIVDRNEARRKRIFIIIFICFFIVMTAVVTTGVVYFVSTAKKPLPVQPTVIMISIDGFRWDYLDLYKDKAPNMNKLRSEGTYSALKPCFPTKTFPNHYTLVTGLYPEAHGIVGNTFYDPVFNATFRIDDQSAVTNARWWGGEPVWVTAQKSGLKSGIYFWPGSEAPIKDTYPTYYMKFNQSVSSNERVDGIISWLEMGEHERPQLLGLYFDVVDTAGHWYGPESTQVADAIAVVDAAIGNLFAYLVKSGKFNSTNLVIVSDHGMTTLSNSRVIYLDDCIDLSAVKVIDWSPNAFILPNNNATIPALLANLTECRSRYPNFTSYLREQVPEIFNFNDNRRITPILAVADLGWTITWKSNTQSFNSTGNHGYDNRQPDMRGLFLAHGPNIHNSSLELVPNLDVYNLVTHILGVSPASNNGTMSLVNEIAKGIL